MEMLVDLLKDMLVWMEAETQKVTGYWNLVMQQMGVANTFFKKRETELWYTNLETQEASLIMSS